MAQLKSNHLGNNSGRVRSCQEKICPPKKFYPRIKIFSDCVENFCPTLKNFVRPAGHVWHCFPWRFQCCWLHVNVFPTVYNLFHHTPRMISDSFLTTWRATPRVTVMSLIQSNNQRLLSSQTIMHWHEVTSY